MNRLVGASSNMRTICAILVAALTSLCTTAGVAQSPGPATRTLADATRASIDSVFAPINRKDSPGCGLGIVRDGQLMYERGYGLASLEHGVPIGPETVFDIASVSKQLTATSIVLLAQRGKLDL